MEDLGGRLVAKSLDDRIGVAVLIEFLRALKRTPHEVAFVFTVQEEVGLRGAGVATFGLEADLGLAVDVTRTSDTPNGAGWKSPWAAARPSRCAMHAWSPRRA